MEKKVIIITGGANGIGFETASLLSKEVNNIVYVLDIDKNRTSVLKKENINFIKCDVSKNKQVTDSIKKIFNKEKRIDILINNAAQQIVSSFKDYNEEEYLKIMRVNYIGACNCISNAIKYMNEGSTIINVLSVHSSLPRTNKYAYDSSKSALEILTKELALELASKKIAINAISFGAVETNMNDSWKTNKEEKENALKKVPLNIIFKPEDIARFIDTIIKSFSKYTTGSVFVIDGGRSLV